MYKVSVIINVKMLEKAYLWLLTVQCIKTFLLQPAGSIPSMFEWKQEETGLICFCCHVFSKGIEKMENTQTQKREETAKIKKGNKTKINMQINLQPKPRY